MFSVIFQAQPKTQQIKSIVSNVSIQHAQQHHQQQQQHQQSQQSQQNQVQQGTPQGVRLVSNAQTSNVRVLSSGQTVRIATSQHSTNQVAQPISTTILRQQPTIITTSAQSGAATGGQVLAAGTTATANIGGKQILLSKRISKVNRFAPISSLSL